MSSEMLIFYFIVLLGAIGLLLLIVSLYTNFRAEKKSQKRIKDAESIAEKEPEKMKPAWNLARITLENYFDRNLKQVTAIFWLCVVVMFVGFIIIVLAIMQAIQAPDGALPPIIAGLAGIITELIGATFLFVYRSTMQQAIKYTKILERINSVGMAIQILDTIPNDAKIENLKDSTKAFVAKRLMNLSFGILEDKDDYEINSDFEKERGNKN